MIRIPSGRPTWLLKVDIYHHHLSMIYLKMVISHSYVSLLEGKRPVHLMAIWGCWMPLGGFVLHRH